MKVNLILIVWNLVKSFGVKIIGMTYVECVEESFIIVIMWKDNAVDLWEFSEVSVFQIVTIDLLILWNLSEECGVITLKIDMILVGVKGCQASTAVTQA